jgi:hypothetical protein
LVVLATLLGLSTLGWFWRHPTAFHGYGGWTVGHESWPVGDPLFVGITYPERGAGGSVTIRAASAHLAGDSTGVEIEFFVCTINEAAGVGAVGAAGLDAISRTCSSLRPVSGAEMTLAETAADQLVMAVTLTEPGRVVIRGVDLSYSHGWQRGTQRVGGDVKIAGVR